MTTQPRAADDFAAIRARMEELRRERDQVVADQKDRPAIGPRPYYRPKSGETEPESWSAPSRPFQEFFGRGRVPVRSLRS